MSSTRTQPQSRGGRSRIAASRIPYTEPSTPSVTRIRARQSQRQRHPPLSSPSSTTAEISLSSTTVSNSGSTSTLHLTGVDNERFYLPSDLESAIPDPLPGLEPIPNSPHPVETIAIPNTPGIVIEITENLGDMGSSRLVFRDSDGVIILPPSYIEIYNPYHPDYTCVPEGQDGQWYYMLNQDCGFHVRDSRAGGDILALAPILDIIPVD